MGDTLPQGRGHPGTAPRGRGYRGVGEGPGRPSSLWSHPERGSTALRRSQREQEPFQRNQTPAAHRSTSTAAALSRLVEQRCDLQVGVIVARPWCRTQRWTCPVLKRVGLVGKECIESQRLSWRWRSTNNEGGPQAGPPSIGDSMLPRSRQRQRPRRHPCSERQQCRRSHPY